MKILITLILFATSLSLHAQTGLPVITSQPVAARVTVGKGVNFTVVATGPVGANGLTGLRYQWRQNGVAVPSALQATLNVFVDESKAGDYDVVVTNSNGSVTSEKARLTVVSPRMINMSVRGTVGNGDTLILGFSIDGTGKRLLLRAIGPGLTQFGVPGALTNPQIKVRTADGFVVADGDDWDERSAALVAAAAQSCGAFPLQAGSKDAAFVFNGLNGNYTLEVTASDAIATAGASRTGVVLAEVYELP